ncbi:hypothetical protein CPLU01_12728 [Colletotrichum plurivorum]|uniref:F-box domain-containing protein n=1 Tax=Colletotrichum plurivorum TaxID=2175906 RepID=A0A8H6JWT8_9PEZI|nr:hypothetical protein CPLU01_12728 [Colletotrichum plurivorum]
MLFIPPALTRSSRRAWEEAKRKLGRTVADSEDISSWTDSDIPSAWTDSNFPIGPTSSDLPGCFISSDSESLSSTSSTAQPVIRSRRMSSASSSVSEMDTDRSLSIKCQRPASISTTRCSVAPELDYTAVIPFRSQDFVPENKRPPVRTGYTRVFELARDANKTNSLIYGIPREIVLEIMACLDPVDMHTARQSCSLFFTLFSVAGFSKLQEPICEPPKSSDASGSSNSQTTPGAVQEDESSLSPALYKPLFKFRLSELGSSQKKRCAALILRDRLCKSCLPDRPVNERYVVPYGSTSRKFCTGCRKDHLLHYFSASQLPRHDAICIAWEGKMRMCSHRSISLSDTFDLVTSGYSLITVLEPCQECSLQFRAERGEEQPNISQWKNVDPSPGCWNSMYTWTVEVCRLGKNQVVTKQLLRESLDDLKNRIGDEVLCPHISFEGPELLEPFDWHHCACFRNPDAGEKQACLKHSPDHYSSGFCCACQNRTHQHAGSFMGGHSDRNRWKSKYYVQHQWSCPVCFAYYSWNLEKRSVTLRHFQSLQPMDVLQLSSEFPRFRMKPETLWSWVNKLDSATFEGGEALNCKTLCGDRSCWNYRARLKDWATSLYRF